MIALGADHAGFEIKEKIKPFLKTIGYDVDDVGTHSAESSDYPDFAHAVALRVGDGRAEYGILVCGSGVGMAIAANKHQGIRAAVAESVEIATLSRRHNNVNVLVLASRFTSWETMQEIIKAFLTTRFEGGRHERRVEKIHTLTNL